MKRLVLASRSPRRSQILTSAGISFSVRHPGIAEVRGDGEAPKTYVQRLALEKARAVGFEYGEIILSADTVVTLDEHVLEKPVDRADAARMLSVLSGRQHEVMTGICLRTQNREIVDVAVTRVFFSPLTNEEIQAYIETGEPDDKAGAYAIQGLASKFVTRIEGCYFNVIGLPVSLVYRYLKDFA